MRSTLIGVGLAVAFLAALFLLAPHRHAIAPAAPAPAELAAKIPADFVGERKIGDWHLVCGPSHQLPKPPTVPGQESGNSSGTAPRQAPPPPGWRIPRCRAMMVLRSPQNPADELRVTYRLMGFQRVLAIFVRFPPNLIETGDPVVLRTDGVDRKFNVGGCAAHFCLAIQSIRKPEERSVVGAKKMAIQFTSPSFGRPIAVSLPTDGLADVIATVHRIDK